MKTFKIYIISAIWNESNKPTKSERSEIEIRATNKTQAYNKVDKIWNHRNQNPDRKIWALSTNKKETDWMLSDEYKG